MKQTQNMHTRVHSGEKRGSGVISGERSGVGNHRGEWRGGGTRVKAMAVSRAGRENTKTVAKQSHGYLWQKHSLLLA